MNVRSTGVQYITNNPERFIKSSTDYSWSRYLANMSHQGTWANTHVIQEWSKLFIHNLKHIHTNFMSEICYSIWFNGKKWSLRNGVGQTIAKMWIYMFKSVCFFYLQNSFKRNVPTIYSQFPLISHLIISCEHIKWCLSSTPYSHQNIFTQDRSWLVYRSSNNRGTLETKLCLIG